MNVSEKSLGHWMIVENGRVHQIQCRKSSFHIVSTHNCDNSQSLNKLTLKSGNDCFRVSRMSDNLGTSQLRICLDSSPDDRCVPNAEKAVHCLSYSRKDLFGAVASSEGLPTL